MMDIVTGTIAMASVAALLLALIGLAGMKVAGCCPRWQGWSATWREMPRRRAAVWRLREWERQNKGEGR